VGVQLGGVRLTTVSLFFLFFLFFYFFVFIFVFYFYFCFLFCVGGRVVGMGGGWGRGSLRFFIFLFFLFFVVGGDAFMSSRLASQVVDDINASPPTLFVILYLKKIF
jgi:hypothetical protein